MQATLARCDVVLVRFPFTDLSAERVRPAIVVGRVTGDDVVLAFVTSRVDGSAAQSKDAHLLHPSDPEFSMTGLRIASTIRLGKLATLERALVRRRIGQVGPRTERAMAACLRWVFEL